MRKIGIESNAYVKSWDTDFDAVFAKMRLHGFDCIDLNLARTNPDDALCLYFKPEAEFVSILERVRKSAENNGIEIYQTHGPWRYPPKDDTEEGRAEWHSFMEKGIYGCSILGCKHFVVHPIMPYGPGEAADEELYYKLNYEFFKSLIPTAEKYGVIICIENMPFGKQSLATPAQITDFVKHLDSENIAMCFDTGHSAVLKVSPADGVRTMGENLKAFHVHDNDTYGDRHECPFFGALNWADFRDALKECVDESVPVMLETSPGKAQMPSELRDMFLPCFAAAAKFLAN